MKIQIIPLDPNPVTLASLPLGATFKFVSEGAQLTGGNGLCVKLKPVTASVSVSGKVSYHQFGTDEVRGCFGQLEVIQVQVMVIEVRRHSEIQQGATTTTEGQ